MIDTYDLYYESLIKNITVGITKVKVIRKARSRELGWNNTWVNGMDSYIGNIYTVKIAYGRRGINLGDYTFPPFVLEIVEE